MARTGAERQADLRTRRQHAMQQLSCWVSAKTYSILKQQAEQEGLTIGDVVERIVTSDEDTRKRADRKRAREEAFAQADARHEARQAKRVSAPLAKAYAPSLLVLGLTPIGNLTREDVEKAFRAKAKAAHPDSGGNVAAFQKLNKAKNAALQFLKILHGG